MYCLYCGSTIANDAQFCESCGKKQNVVIASPAPPSIQRTVAPKMRSKATIWVLMVILDMSYWQSQLRVFTRQTILQANKSNTRQRRPVGERDDEFEKRVRGRAT